MLLRHPRDIPMTFVMRAVVESRQQSSELAEYIEIFLAGSFALLMMDTDDDFDLACGWTYQQSHIIQYLFDIIYSLRRTLAIA